MRVSFRLLPLCLLLLARAAFAAGPAVPTEGFTHVKTLGDISEYTLDSNGLQVLLMPEHSAPVLTFMVTYRVGSANEVTGTTGATHLLEHLMFKGTERFNRAQGTGYDQLLEQSGAVYNATTWLDRTNYYANLASDKLPMMVELEADRMRNLLLKDEDRRPEMTVVRNEFERGENNPFQALIKEIFQAAYVAHPYHHSTIGWRSDIEKVSIEKLREFYDQFYWPDNATVSVIGDFKPDEALALIRQHYGKIPRAPKPIPQVYTEEPEQSFPRRVGVRRAGQLGVVALGHKVPAGTHADYPALTVLSAILTDGKNSRLYRALTDQNLTTSVQAFLGFNRSNTLHITFAALAPGARHEDVEKATVAEIERLKKDGATDLEVTTAINKLLADAAFQRDGSFAVAGNLNESIAVGDWTTYYRVEEMTRAVTAADVKRVANLYFNEAQSTIGWFVPVEETEAPAQPAAPAPAARSDLNLPRPAFYRDPAFAAADAAAPGSSASTPAPAPSTANFAKNVIRESVHGIDLIQYPTGVKNVVTFRGSIAAGDVFARNGNPALATLAGSMLDKGTLKRDKFAVSQLLESVGATLSFSVDNYTVRVSGQCLKKDVPVVISLLGEMLREPAFSAEEFGKLKTQLAGTFRRALESPEFRANEAFTRALYPEGHPNRDLSVAEMLAAIESATLEEVKAFHAATYGPQHMILVAVGDIDPATLRSEVSNTFAGWSGGQPVPPVPNATNRDASRDQVVFMSEKPSVAVSIGQTTGLRYSDPDYFALRIGTAILGDGFTGRLMGTVRDQEGLTYGIDSALANDTYGAGDWRITATFAPDLLAQGLESTRRELKTWHEKGVTADELERRKSNVIGSFKVNLATTTGIASQLLANAMRGKDAAFLDAYPDLIQSLTPEQVNAAIRKHLDPEGMVTIKAGTVHGGQSAK